MRVRVLFFGRLRDVVGCAEDWAEVPAGARVEEVFARYTQANPRVGEFRASLAASVNEEYAQWSASVREGDEIAFLPPVSGG